MIARYALPAMAKIWSDESRLAHWLEVELAALDAWADVGTVPAEDVAEIRAHAVAPSPDTKSGAISIWGTKSWRGSTPNRVSVASSA